MSMSTNLTLQYCHMTLVGRCLVFSLRAGSPRENHLTITSTLFTTLANDVTIVCTTCPPSPYTRYLNDGLLLLHHQHSILMMPLIPDWPFCTTWPKYCNLIGQGPQSTFYTTVRVLYPVRSPQSAVRVLYQPD